MQNLTEIVESWKQYYPKPQGKVRASFSLANPSLTVESFSALAHDFYYFTDEFSILFEPIYDDKKVFLLLEAGHQFPKGERIPILSTWSHLHRDAHESGMQEAFAFFDNKWWTVANINEQVVESNSRWDAFSCSSYRDRYWCGCSGYTLDLPTISVKIGDHHARTNIKDMTLFNDSICGELTALYYGANIDILIDYLEERGDPFGVYLRNAFDLKSKYGYTYNLTELKHMCKFIEAAKNDRSTKLLLLAKALINTYCR